MPPETIHDVLIIGAGPAGASAAIRARLAGLSAVVVEKQPFPRFRIGESLLPAGNALLQELGVWQKISRAGFVEKHGARFLLGAGEAEKKVVFSTGLVPGLEQTWQVDRARFDALLLDHARELGAEILPETTVRSLAESGDEIHAALESASPASASSGSARRIADPAASSESASGSSSSLPAPSSTLIRARYVIDASGRDQFFPSELKAALEPAAFPRRLAIYSHFRGVPREPGAAGGDTIIVRLPEGWFWIIPIDAERTSVGLVTTQTAFRAAGLSPAEHFARVVSEAPRLRALLADAAPTMGFHVTADYSYYRRELARGRLVLAGDSGGFLDPIFSSGVYLALRSAKHAVELVVNARRERRPFSPAECRRYTRDSKAHARVFHRLIDAFYDDDAFSVFMCAQVPFNLAPGLTSIVAGHARLTWPLWWRFRVFLLVCRLQRRLALVPRLDLRRPETVPPGPEPVAA